MFTVYRITNLTNGKAYIGSTVRPVEKRWAEHKNSAFNPNAGSYHYPLQCAIRKYNVNNFLFEILQDDFEAIEQMQQYEHDQIVAQNTLAPHGYNQTENTDRSSISIENANKHVLKISVKCAKIDAQNNILETYTSYHDAARKNGWDGDARATTIRSICKGKISSCDGLIFRDLDENGNIIKKPFTSPRGRKKVIGVNLEDPSLEVIFPSVTEAARQMHADRGSIGKCIKGEDRYSHVKGYIWRALDLDGSIIENEKTIDDRIQEYNAAHPLINGERHTIKEWCNIYNISTTTYYERLKRGMSQIDAIITEKER